MAVFMTKVYGFSEPLWPLSFGLRGYLERARSMLRPGDLVALVGTKGDETAPAFQGMLLGLMEPTTERVRTLDFPIDRRSVDIDASGAFRWPYALLIKRGWRFVPPVPFNTISSRRFSMDAAAGIVPLEPNEASRLMELPKREVAVMQPNRRGVGGDDVRGWNAPPPAEGARRGVMHLRRAPASTYAFKLIGARGNAVKIGWAFDPKQRLRLFNSHSMPSLDGIQYAHYLTQSWPQARDAFSMEQDLLRRFQAHRHPQNGEIVTDIADREIELAWFDLCGAFKR